MSKNAYFTELKSSRFDMNKCDLETQLECFEMNSSSSHYNLCVIKHNMTWKCYIMQVLYKCKSTLNLLK